MRYPLDPEVSALYIKRGETSAAALAAVGLAVPDLWALRTTRWLIGRGQVPEAELTDVPKEFTPAELARWSMASDTPVGRLHHLGPVVRLSETPPRWARPSVPLGSHEPVWPARAT
jgi:hypothetical protein